MKRLGLSYTKYPINSPVDPHRRIYAVIVECERDDLEQMLGDVREALDLLDEKRRNF
jgi:hypothetical protein